MQALHYRTARSYTSFWRETLARAPAQAFASGKYNCPPHKSKQVIVMAQ